MATMKGRNIVETRDNVAYTGTNKMNERSRVKRRPGESRVGARAA